MGINSCDKQMFKIGTILEKQEHKVMITTVEGLRLLHGLEANLATSLQTPQEA